ncbi:hypothetical protein ACFL25_00060 [Patescibacteria group bacterium]
MTGKETKNTRLDPLQLKRYLSARGIPVEEWGTVEPKTIQHLLDDVNGGGCQLIEHDNQLLRQVEFASVDVYYVKKDETYVLVEDRQEFKDGRVKRRGFGWSVSEKMTPNEEPLNGANRAILEELGLDGEFSIIQEEVVTYTKTSPSYPELTSNYWRYHFSVVLSDEQFRPNGYVEEQPDKTTYFIWKKQ